MTEFAVRVVGEDEKRGYWVLAIDVVRDRFLLASEDGKLRWVPIVGCLLVKAVNPDQPRSVIAYQPPQPLVINPHNLAGLDGRK